MITPEDRMLKIKSRRLGARGQTMVEFALAVPVLLTILVGAAVFGLAINNYETLTFASAAGAQLLSISRGPQVTDPCKVTAQAISNIAPGLTGSKLSLTIAFGTGNPFVATQTFTGTAASSGGISCTTANMVANGTAQVTATYPCNLQVLAYNPAPTCNLTAQTAVLIQ